MDISYREEFENKLKNLCDTEDNIEQFTDKLFDFLIEETKNCMHMVDKFEDKDKLLIMEDLEYGINMLKKIRVEK